MNKQRNLYPLLFCLCMACFSSCNEEQMTEQQTAETAAVEEIKNLIASENLSLPDVTLNADKATRSSQKLYYTPGAITPRWDGYQKVTEENATVWIFQLNASESLSGMIESYYYGKEETQTANAIFKLAVRQQGGKSLTRIITYIPDEGYMEEQGIDASQLGYNLEEIRYSGKLIISTLSGRIVFGKTYKNGEVVYNFSPKGNVLCSADGKTKYAMEQSDNFRLSFNLFAQGRNDLPDALTCTACGHAADECTCMVLLKAPGKATRMMGNDNDKKNDNSNNSNEEYNDDDYVMTDWSSWWIIIEDMETPL